MPELIAVAAGAFGSELVGGGILGAVVGTAVTILASQTLGKFDDQGFGAEQRGNQVVLRSAVEAQRIVYGELVVSGPLVYSRVSRDTAKAQESFVVPPSAPYTISVLYATEHIASQLVESGFQDTSGDVVTFVSTVLTLTAGAPGPDEYSVAAGVHTFHSSRAGQSVFIMYTHGGNTQLNSWLHLVIPLAYHQVEEIGDVYFGADVITSSMLDADGLVTSGKYAFHAKVRKHLGAASQSADSYLVSVCNGQWTSEHRGDGVAYIVVSLRRNIEIYISGVPNIRAKVRGALLYDPRTSTTAYSNNWALVVYDYLRRAEGLGCAASELNETLVNAAANVSDEDVALDATPTYQKRYTADGVVNLDGRPLDILRELLGAGAGVAVYSVNTWDLYAGAYVAPTRTLTVSDLRDDITGAPDLPRRDLFNAVRGTFVDPNGDWQETSFPPVRNSNYVTEDGGEEIYRDLELGFTTNVVRAQRLAKIVLERARQSATLAWPGKRTCFRINTWETVNIQVAQLGYTPKVFRVNNWQWQPGGGVDLGLQEESAAAYDWAFGEATVRDPAPNTTLPAAGPVAAPGAPEISEELYETRDGRGVAARAIMQWVRSPDAYADHYQPEYKLATNAQWTRLPTTVDLRSDVNDISAGEYDFRVCTVDGFGRRSIFSQTRAEITGLGARPAAPTGVSIQIAGATAILSLDHHAELDVLRGGRMLVRHTEATSSQSWEESLSIGNQESYPGDSVVVFLPLKPGSYLVKARDSTGQESASFAAAVTKQASVLAFTALATPLQEDNTYPGTHTNTVVTGSALLLDTSGGAVLPSGSYAFVTGFDFGSVKRARITGRIEAVVFNANDLIDSRTDPIDNWLSFDGSTGIGSLGDAWLETRETDDDPAGAPTWSAWKRVDAAEFECRGMQFRLQMRSFDPTYNTQVDILRVKAEEVL